MTARTDAAARHEILPAVVLEIDRDQCQNTYGVAPCTAGVTQSGTAQAGSASTTLVLAAGASAVDDAYNGQTLRLTGGMGAGQERVIADYVGATKAATVGSRWITNLVPNSKRLGATVGVIGAGGVMPTGWVFNIVTGLTREVVALGTMPDGTEYIDLRLYGTNTSGGVGYPDIYTMPNNVAAAVVGETWVASGYLEIVAGSRAGLASANSALALSERNATGNYLAASSSAHFNAERGAVARTFSNAATAYAAIYYNLAINNGQSVDVTIRFAAMQLEKQSASPEYVGTSGTAINLPDATTTYAVINRPAACYNSYGNCQDKPNYVKGTQTDRFCSRGMAAPAGETIRPYVTAIDNTPTEIVPGKGLAMRGTTTLTLVDEPCADHTEDPHHATRAAVAGGTFWGRFMARNRHLVGRFARVRRGYITAPFDWATFQTELYIITAMAGPDASGQIKLTLQDPIKLLDTAKLPAATDGKLAAEFAAVSHTGVVVSATATTAVLPSTGNSPASAVDGAYVGQELYIYANTGAGQRRTITAYVGATRTATVATWSVNPDSTSSYQIGPLSLTLATGKGTQYADPATSGKQEFVRVGKEIIRYTAKTGDVLSWPDTTYRAAFGSTLEDHKVDDLVQLCRAYIDQTPAAVVQSLLNEGGIANGYIDLTQLADECTQWLSGLLMTDCLSAPESVSALLADLLVDLSAAMWWDAVAQQAKFKVNMPAISSAVGTLTDDDVLLNSVKVERQDKDRITRQAMYFALANAAEDRKKSANYLRGTMYIDTGAESANEYGDSRPAVRQSHWLSTANSNHATAWAGRQVARLRDAPAKISFKVPPRSEQAIGALVNLSLRARVDETGQPKTLLVRVVRVDQDNGLQDVTCLTTGFARRYAFIAPNGQPDYPAASEAQRAYAYIATTATQKMSNGDDPYRII